MIPANAKHLVSLPKSASTILHTLLERRDCRIVTGNAVKWHQSPGVLGAFLKIGRNDLPFKSSQYSLITNTLLFGKELAAMSELQHPVAIFKCHKNVAPHIQAVVNNFCGLHSIPTTNYRVEMFSNLDTNSENVIDFLCRRTEDFSVNLVAEQLKLSRKDVESVPGVRLSHILQDFACALDWQNSFKQYSCNVLVQSLNQEIPHSFRTLEHVLQSKLLQYPIVIQTPVFTQKMKYIHDDFGSNCAYDTYQYCLQIPDSGLERALICLTTYDKTETEDILTKHRTNPNEYYGQKKIAENIIAINNGDGKLVLDCEKAAGYLFKGKISTLANISESDLRCLERVCHVIDIPYTKDITFSALCELGYSEIPIKLQTRFHLFAEELMADSSLTCNGAEIRLDHTFSERDMISGVSILVCKSRKKQKAAFIIKWRMPE